MSPPYVFTARAGGTIYNVLIRSVGYKDYPAQFDLVNDVEAAVGKLPAASNQTISDPLIQYQVRMSSDAAFIRTLTEASAVPALINSLALVKTWLWTSLEFKASWNAILDHALVTDPSSGEVAIWGGYLTTVGYTGISFTVTGRIS